MVAQTKAFIQNNPDALDVNGKRDLVLAAQHLAALCGQLGQAGKDWVRGDATDDAVKAAAENIKKQLNNIRAINAKVQGKGKANPALVQAARSLADATSGLITTLKAVSARPKDQSAHSQMSASVGHVTENIKRVLEASSALVPGQRECDAAINDIQAAIGDLAASRYENRYHHYVIIAGVCMYAYALCACVRMLCVHVCVCFVCMYAYALCTCMHTY